MQDSSTNTTRSITQPPPISASPRADAHQHNLPTNLLIKSYVSLSSAVSPRSPVFLQYLRPRTQHRFIIRHLSSREHAPTSSLPTELSLASSYRLGHFRILIASSLIRGYAPQLIRFRLRRSSVLLDLLFARCLPLRVRVPSPTTASIAAKHACKLPQCRVVRCINRSNGD